MRQQSSVQFRSLKEGRAIWPRAPSHHAFRSFASAISAQLSNQIAVMLMAVKGELAHRHDSAGVFGTAEGFHLSQAAALSLMTNVCSLLPHVSGSKLSSICASGGFRGLLVRRLSIVAESR